MNRLKQEYQQGKELFTMEKKLLSLFNSMPSFPERTDSVIAQMMDLVQFAKKLGMCEVVDGLNEKIAFNQKWYGPKPLHPEQRSGEINIANSTEKTFRYIGWKTKRFGEVAYDIDGKIVPGDVPVFIMASEYEAAGLLTDRDTIKE
jgi:hypothetical protein